MSYDPTLELDIAQTDIVFANNNHHWCYVRVTVVVDAETGDETQSAEIVVSEAHIDPMQYWESSGQIHYKLGHFAEVVDGKREAHLIWGGLKTIPLISSVVTEEITNNTQLQETIRTIASSGNHESHLIENTTNVSETVVSSWSVLPYAQQVGEFKAVVMVRNKATDTIKTLIALLSFDYSEAPSVVLQSDLLTDAALTLTVGVNGSDMLYATIAGMPTDAKRIHFCFERCVLSQREWLITAANNEMGLTMSAEMSSIDLIGNPEFAMGMTMSAEVTEEIASAGALVLIFDDLANSPVVDSSNLAQWNAFFDLPTNGTAFTSVVVEGTTVNLIGGSNITLKAGLFGDYTNTDELYYGLLSVDDQAECVIACADSAFSYLDVGWGCGGLHTVKLPVCVSLGGHVFKWCSVATLVLPFDSYTILNEYVFFGCESLIGAITFNNVVDVKQYALSYTGLTEINLPACEITRTGALSMNGNLTSIYFPVLVTAEDEFIGNNYSLTEIHCPELKTLGGWAVFQTDILTVIDFPKLETAASYAFTKAVSVEDFYFPLLTTIGEECFARCFAMKSLYIPSCTQLGNPAYEDYPLDSGVRVFGSQIYTTPPSYINGNNITLTVPAALMTSNAGNPDKDIQWLQANNTVTVVTV